MNEDITFFGITNFRNSDKNFGIKMDDRRRHMYLVGKSGSAKTTIMETMVINDIKAGYANCEIANPTYEKVCAGNTGCYEAIQIDFDPQKIAYRVLLNTFWHQIDPRDFGGQFSDRGEQYRSAILYHDDEQKNQAQRSKTELEISGKFDKPLATQIIAYKNFYPAEDYHQQYYKKNPLRYQAYKKGSGRQDFIDRNWEN